MKLRDSLIDALTITSGAYPVPKSLTDLSGGGLSVDTQPGVASLEIGLSDERDQIFKKRGVRQWRLYSERSWAVRAAIDIHRNFVFLAQPDVTAIDYKKKVDVGVRKEIEDLLTQRMQMGDSYRSIKEQMLEDYFVVGYGAIELLLNNKVQPIDMKVFNADNLGFYRWDGDPNKPRYCEINSARKAVRKFSDQQMMVMVNRKAANSLTGLSNMEVLNMAIEGLMYGDDHTLTELRAPAPSGALNLGEGIGQDVADKVRSKITNSAKWTFIVMSGAKKPQFIPFKERDLKALDKQQWFVRQVCAIFGLPTVALAQKVDTVQSNTDALLQEKAEGLCDTVLRIQEMENMEIVRKYGDPREHNLQIVYPVLGRKNELKQAELLALQLGKEQAWATINEARIASGLDPRPEAAADTILINTSTGLVSLADIPESPNKPPSVDEPADLTPET
jgi:hypothetical protein